MRDNPELEDLTRLRAAVETATAEHEEAKRRFWRAATEVPTGIRAVDRSVLIEKAARAQTAAMAALAESIKHLNDFLVREMITEGRSDIGIGPARELSGAARRSRRSAA